MKFRFLLITFTLFCSMSVFSQGTNNDFDYDEKDLNVIFSELGFTTFKFPIKQDTNQIFDFVIEEFKNGEIISSRSIIEYTKDQFKEYGLDPINYFQAKKDSIYFHRFYFIKRDTALIIKVNTHGVTTLQNIKTLGQATFDLRTQFEIKTEIDSLGYIECDKQKDLLFLYANAPNDKEPLWCPAGMPRELVIKKFYYVLFVSIKEYKL